MRCDAMRTTRTISSQYAYWWIVIVVVIVIVIVPTACSALVCVGVFMLPMCVGVCVGVWACVCVWLVTCCICNEFRFVFQLHPPSRRVAFSFVHFVFHFVSRKLCIIFFPSKHTTTNCFSTNLLVERLLMDDALCNCHAKASCETRQVQDT